MRGHHEKFELRESDDASALSTQEAALIYMASLGYSYAEMANFYSLKLGTVKSKLSRARAKIRAQRQPMNAAPEENAQV